MLYCLISPAKRLNDGIISTNITQPQFLNSSLELAKVLKTYSVKGVKELMGLSEKLAQLNYDRFQEFSEQGHASPKAMPAVFAFYGDVYRYMKAESWSEEDLNRAQISLGILSGMYGLLRPLDVILPYRLEMGTSIKTSRGSNLYSFWQEQITTAINQHMQNNNLTCLINLASEEYSKAVKFNKVEQSVVKVDFKDFTKGRLRTVGVKAKRARGAMADLLMRQPVNKADEIKAYEPLGYQYDAAISNESTWVFVSKENL